jgi:hypothetical protein
LESLFIYATKKEVIKKITENLNREKEADDWKIVKNIRKTKIPKELIIPKYEEVEAVIPTYTINKLEYKELIDYVGLESGIKDKLALMQVPTNVSKTLVSALDKIRDDKNFKFEIEHSGRTPMDNLLLLNNHFHQKPKRLKNFQPILTEINHFEKIEIANLPDGELLKLEQFILDSLDSEKLKYSSVNDIVSDYNNKKITEKELQHQISLFNNQGVPIIYNYNGLKLEINTKFLSEHYYNPLLLSSESNKQLFKHIVWVESEVEFLRRLDENKEKLSKYDWWYFSKLDESTDDVSIPYYDSALQQYRNFFPDFIFWLKEKDSDNLIIKFIDPKGNRIGTGNAEDKAKGYENIFNDHSVKFEDKEVNIDLYFYNESIGVNDSVKGYFTKSFDRMFKK